MQATPIATASSIETTTYTLIETKNETAPRANGQLTYKLILPETLHRFISRISPFLKNRREAPYATHAGSAMAIYLGGFQISRTIRLGLPIFFRRIHPTRVFRSHCGMRHV
jgi:hypothetical protein